MLVLPFAARARASCSTYSRPIPLGVCGSSVRSHCGCVTGTLGSTVKDFSGTQYILSNNHILALFNNGVAGDDITQPACAGTSKTVAHLTRFITLSTSANNTVDAAIAKVVSGQVNTTDYILNIGSVSSTTSCAYGLYVQKQGAGSGLSSGQILSCDVSLNLIDPCTGYTYPFVSQIESGGWSVPPQPADSGSLLVTQGTPTAVGLIFATGQNVIYANPIGTVLSDFEDSMALPSGTAAAGPAGTQPALTDEQILAGETVDTYSHQLLSTPGVWGVGAYANPNGNMYIRASVDAVTPELQQEIPSTLGGFSVVINARRAQPLRERLVPRVVHRRSSFLQASKGGQELANAISVFGKPLSAFA
ncbi:MAG: hypothetical protein ACREQI_15695, partial [Candidatus Binataceae bacterium]